MSEIYRKVIVGTDGSATAQSAVRAALTVAQALGVPLAVATAWRRHPSDEPPRSELAEIPGGEMAGHELHWAEETVSDAAGVARAAGIEDVRVLTPEGSPAEALIKVGDQNPDSLIVVGTLGLTQRSERLVGNIPHLLTHHSHRDLLLVNARSEETEHTWPRVALATDGSTTATMACKHGLDLASALGADVTLLTVAANEERGHRQLDDTAAELDASAITRRVATGRHPADVLVEVGGEYDLLVVGNKGMSGPSRLLGSVANPVTHHVPTDLLLVNTTR